MKTVHILGMQSDSEKRLLQANHAPFVRTKGATADMPVSGELIPRPNFTLCKSKSTACRLNSQWLRTDQKSRSHQSMNSTSDRSLIGHIVRFTPTTKSSDKSRSDRRLVQASTVRLPSIGRQIRNRSWFPSIGCLPLQ